MEPTNSQHLVVAANSWQAGNGHFEVYVYASFDGGNSWSASQPYINRNADRLNGADPTVAFGPDGSVYASFVAFLADGAVAVSRSLDGGRTWASQSWATSFVGGAADKPALVAGNGYLYLFWQGSSLYGRMSKDNGSTWSTGPSLINSVGRNATPVVTGIGVTVFYMRGNSLMAATPFSPSVSNAPVLVSTVQPAASPPDALSRQALPDRGHRRRGTLSWPGRSPRCRPRQRYPD